MRCNRCLRAHRDSKQVYNGEKLLFNDSSPYRDEHMISLAVNGSIDMNLEEHCCKNALFCQLS